MQSAVSSQRRSLAEKALQLAEKAVEAEKELPRKVSGLNQIACGWITLDHTRAKQQLERAWQESLHIKDPKARGFEQVDIVLLGWAGLDVEKARSLIPKTSYPYWRDFATTGFARSVAAFDTKRGALLLQAIPEKMDREREVMEASYNIMREDPDRAVRLIQAIPNVDQDGLIHGVIYNIARTALPRLASPGGSTADPSRGGKG